MPLVICACAAGLGAEGDAAGKEKPTFEDTSRRVNEDGVVTFVSGLKIMVERDGKRAETNIVAAGSPIILKCRAWAEDAEVSEVVFQFVDENEKVLGSAKGTRREKSDCYEAETDTPNVAGQVRFRVTVKTKRKDPPAEPPAAVKPPKPPEDF
ncbi:MAG: hypothetical protein NTW87_31375 [Planctomycetota bacterium]|nr:hypothetical protein [Planctomycetota bacterium]